MIPFSNRHRRFKIAIGGRASTKSTTFAGICMMQAYYGHKVYCLREHKTSIAKSVYPLILSEIKKYKVPGFSYTKTEIVHKVSGGKFDFGGIARCIEDIKSSHGYTIYWLEEGQFISEESIRTLTPTLRERGGELWISANPKNSQDPFSKRFINPFIKNLDKYGYHEDDLHLIVKVNYSDNDWFPEDLNKERLFDKKHLSRAMYDHIWNGAFNDSVEDSIILAEWVDASIDAHNKLGFKPTGIKVLSHDPSDLGPDEKALVVRHGSIITQAENRSIGDVNEGCDWALDTAIENQVDLFTWDEDGMGVSLKRQIDQALKGKKIDYKPFSGAREPDLKHEIYEPVKGSNERQKRNGDVFLNKRAQYYWQLRNRFFNTYLAVEKGQYMDPEKMISISSDIEDLSLLRSEICRIPRVFNSHGKIQIMGKKEMKKLKILSPNVADSLMMSFPLNVNTVPDDSPILFDSFY